MKERIEYCITYSYYGSDTIQYYEDDSEGEVAVVRCTDYVTEI